MTVVLIGNYKTVTKFLVPADTNAAVIYTPPSDRITARLVGINIAGNATSGSASVWLREGSTDYPLLDAKAISTNTSELYEFGNPVIPYGNSIKVKTSAANNLAFTVTIAEMLPST